MSEFVNAADAIADLEGGGQDQQVVDTPQQVQAAAPVEETLYEVKINGQTHKVPLTELTSGYSRQQDYTRKTTELAEQRRQWEDAISQRDQQIQEVRQFFAHPQVQQALAALRAGSTDPNAQLTVQQAQQLMQSQFQQANQVNEQRLAQMAYEIEVRNLASGYAREIDGTIQSLNAKHPVLADIDGFDQILRQKVAERQPQTLEETKRLFVEIGEAAAAKLEARYATQQKQAAVQNLALKKNGIEPPGGTTQPLPQSPKLRIGSNELFQQAVADMLGQ